MPDASIRRKKKKDIFLHKYLVIIMQEPLS